MKRATSLTGRIRPTRFGEMLRLYRTVNQLTLRELASQCGISHATLMRIEHGQRFDVQTLLTLWTWLFEPKDA